MALATERKRRKFKENYIYRDQNSLAGSIGVVWLRSPTRDFPPSAKKAGQGGLSYHRYSVLWTVREAAW